MFLITALNNALADLSGVQMTLEMQINMEDNWSETKKKHALAIVGQLANSRVTHEVSETTHKPCIKFQQLVLSLDSSERRKIVNDYGASWRYFKELEKDINGLCTNGIKIEYSCIDDSAIDTWKVKFDWYI